MKTIAIISNQAFSLINFRGPLIKALVDEGTRVYALAPDYSDELRQQVKMLGTEPIDYNFVRTEIQSGQKKVQQGIEGSNNT